ncbi:hypothetical protein Tsubulata_001351 [Turnera subulata]|uniref:Malectin-like domain-containing protein n=1 Tax=Turnera subulata TaxID=218843 RepID=A0A9Q0FJG9_9ROSI|nr:hypothetical protein Tsubulata_001351 [Turnera subulata]
MYINTQVLLFSLACSCLLINAALLVAGANPPPLFLDCGSENGGIDGDGREWVSDIKYISGSYPRARAQYQDSAVPSEIPLMDARIFSEEATYQLPVKPATRFFLRLHFYPAEYSSLNISNSYFSVVAAGVTLLKNFSAAITAQATTQAYLVREYSLAPIDVDVLNVTFKPENVPDAFAFINAIELIPSPDLFRSAKMVGFDDQTLDSSSANLQTMYRVNIGGQYIAPTNDSGGLMRTWYDDVPYLYGGGFGVLESEERLKIDYGGLSKDVAPEDIYRTARASGIQEDVAVKSNLSWAFQVDANFTYVVRLHFCELQLSKINQKVFYIYINNQTAQIQADIIAWTGRKGAPTFKDYSIYVNDRPGDDDLRLDLQPTTETNSEFFDASLNGLEVFKLSDRNNLAGPNPELSEMLAKYVNENNKSFESHNNKVVIGAAGGAAGFCLVAALCIAAYQRKKKEYYPDTHTSSWLPIYGNSHTNASGTTISGKSTIEDIIDPQIKGQIKPECLKKFADTAQKCLADAGYERPNMGDVLWNLEFALQLQETPEGSQPGAAGDGNEPSDESIRKKHYSNLSLGNENEL